MARKWKDEDVKPWERQPGETEKAWEAFSCYLHLEERSITNVCKKLSKTRELIARWKDKWFWYERVRAYDNELERQAFAQAVKDRKEMNKRHINLAMRVQAAAYEALKTKDFKKMPDKCIPMFIKIATELERQARADEIAASGRVIERGAEPGNENEEVVIYVPDNGLGNPTGIIEKQQEEQDAED